MGCFYLRVQTTLPTHIRIRKLFPENKRGSPAKREYTGRGPISIGTEVHTNGTISARQGYLEVGWDFRAKFPSQAVSLSCCTVRYGQSE
jgi:hypothetical protein